MMGAAGESPYPVIRLFNTSGKVELQLFATDDGPSAIMVGTPLRSFAVLSAGEREAGSALLMRDLKAEMSLTTDTLALARQVYLTGSDPLGKPLMHFRNKQGETIFEAP
jgi:hypothetical protein